eukprot:2583473-Rhodomonas_salina.1
MPTVSLKALSPPRPQNTTHTLSSEPPTTTTHSVPPPRNPHAVCTSTSCLSLFQQSQSVLARAVSFFLLFFPKAHAGTVCPMQKSVVRGGRAEAA